jgi:hypothetical protein
MKKIALLLLASAIMLFSACSQQPAEPSPTPSNEMQSSPSPIAPSPSQGQTQATDGIKTPVFVFLNQTFVGEFDSGKWFSVSSLNPDKSEADDILLKDVVAQEYVCYEDGKKTMEPSQFLRYSDEDFGLSGLQTEGAEERFKQFGTNYVRNGQQMDGYMVYPLPLTLDSWFDTVMVPWFNFTLEFGQNNEFPNADFGEEESSKKRLALSADFDPFPREIRTIEATKQAEEALVSLFAEQKMENTKPRFAECYLGDLDNDGKDESLFFANHKLDENMWPLLEGIDGKTEGLGTYSVILYQEDDGSVQTIYSDLHPYEGKFEEDSNPMELLSIDHCTTLTPGAIADVNKDGTYEFGCDFAQWEGGNTRLFALDGDGKYQTVLRANWGA